MCNENVTLIVGLSSIVATLIAGGMGLYFTAKARSSPLREALFAKQLDLIVRIIHKQGKVRVLATILAGKDDTFKERAREDIGECVKEFSEMQDEAAAVLPTELWVEVKRLSDKMTDILVCYDEKGDIEESSFRTLVALATKVALVSRAVMGVEELTEESLNLFSSKKDYESLASMEVKHFEEMHKRVNT